MICGRICMSRYSGEKKPFKVIHTIHLVAVGCWKKDLSRGKIERSRPEKGGVETSRDI